MIKNIFFDFDGVLAESVNIKTEAFRQMYMPYGNEIAAKVVEHHISNGGVSRFEKFKLYHGEWLGKDVTDSLLKQLAQEFSDLVLKGVVNSPEVKGASDFLENNKGIYKYWIISGTPTEEMKEIARQRKMNNYFQDIFGSPVKKPEWVAYILEKWNLKAEGTVFIGDAKSDYEAAKKNGLHFVLRETPENASLFIDFDGHKIKDLVQLNKILKKIK